MIAKYYGKVFSLDALSRRTSLGEYRLSLFGVFEAAEFIGFDVLAARVSFDDLKTKVPLPCIIHWQAKHFVVVYKIGRNHVFVADPVKGKCRYKREDFVKGWHSQDKRSDSRIVLLLEPNSRFYTMPEDTEEDANGSRIDVYIDKIKKIFSEQKRKKIRHSLAKTRPSPLPGKDRSMVIHMLLGKNHVEMAICTCKTVCLAMEAPCVFVFHDDGSLDNGDTVKLLSQFPGSKVIERSVADALAEERLKDYPMCKFVRDNNFMWIKFFDVFFWSDDERIAYMDSDIVFFKQPEQFIKELANRDGNNLFNRDIATGYFYTLSLGDIERLIGHSVIPRINAGLWILDHSVLKLDLVEKWLSDDLLKDWLTDYFLDQMLIAALASVHNKKAIYFDEGYDISLNKKASESVCKHYVGNIRSGYEFEGLEFLLRKKDFLNRWGKFLNQFSSA